MIRLALLLALFVALLYLCAGCVSFPEQSSDPLGACDPRLPPLLSCAELTTYLVEPACGRRDGEWRCSFVCAGGELEGLCADLGGACAARFSLTDEIACVAQ